jgi:hypothetical protein
MLRIRHMAFLLAYGSLITFTACQSTRSSPAVDRHDPEAVLRAYFAAWARNDSDAQKSFMAATYSKLTFAREPVDSLHLLSVAVTDATSPTKRFYSVSFDVTFAGGRSISMENGRYYWTYTLNWDATRNSWLIADYGAG